MKKKIFDKFLPLLIMIQPLFDVLTSFMTRANFTITIGMVIKVFLIFICLIYLIFFDKNKRVYNYLFIACLLVLFIANITINMDIIKTNFFEYFNYFFKYFYLVILMFYFIKWVANGGKIQSERFRIPLIIISITFFLALLSRTSFYSYDTYRRGFSGWYNSANELGSLLCLLFPLAIYNAFHNPNKKFIDYILFFSCGIMLILVGTKAAFFGFLLVLTSYIIYRVIMYKRFKLDFKLFLSFAVLIIPFFFIEDVPAVYNTNISINNYNNKIANEILEDTTSSYVSSVILSGRDNYTTEMESNRDEDSIKVFEIVFGKSYNNSKGSILIVEQDFFDIFYMYGIFGLLIFLFLLFYLFVYLLIFVTRNFKKSILDIELFLLVVSVGLILSISFISGHNLLSPSVSTYFVSVFSIIYAKIESPSKNRKFSFKNQKKGNDSNNVSLLKAKKINSKY